MKRRISTDLIWTPRWIKTRLTNYYQRNETEIGTAEDHFILILGIKAAHWAFLVHITVNAGGGSIHLHFFLTSCCGFIFFLHALTRRLYIPVFKNLTLIISDLPLGVHPCVFHILIIANTESFLLYSYVYAYHLNLCAFCFNYIFSF